MSEFPNLIVVTTPFRGQKLIRFLLLATLAAGLFFTAIAVYVTTHKHKQPSSRSPHVHAIRTP